MAVTLSDFHYTIMMAKEFTIRSSIRQIISVVLLLVICRFYVKQFTLKIQV